MRHPFLGLCGQHFGSPARPIRRRVGPGNNVVIVGIDDKSLQTIRQYPLPRSVYAKAP